MRLRENRTCQPHPADVIPNVEDHICLAQSQRPCPLLNAQRNPSPLHAANHSVWKRILHRQRRPVTRQIHIPNTATSDALTRHHQHYTIMRIYRYYSTNGQDTTRNHLSPIKNARQHIVTCPRSRPDPIQPRTPICHESTTTPRITRRLSHLRPIVVTLPGCYPLTT